MISHQIQKRFSASAPAYDAATSLHRQMAERLIATIKGQSPSAIVDVGCGTGYLTGRLKEQFPQAQILGLDFAQGMLKAAGLHHEGIAWILADGLRLPLSDASMDAVVSNAAYQWSADLTRALAEARRVLKPQGVLSCTLFGFNTCGELFEALSHTTSLRVTRLPKLSDVRHSLLTSGFDNPQVNSRHAQLNFESMQQLLAWLKTIGANNLRQTGFLGPRALSRAASIYRQKFSKDKGVAATFEVIEVYAKK